MAHRASFSKQKYLGIGAAGLLVLIGVIVIALEVPGSSVPPNSNKAFYTVDDGKTWFVDDGAKIPPFDKDGKQAVRAYVFRCADGKMFVGTLERFTAAAKRVLEQSAAAGPNNKNAAALAAQVATSTAREVKRPGDTTWVGPLSSAAAAKVMAVRCPDGGAGAVPVEP